MTGNTRDFIWSQERDPHVARRKAILAEHPEVRELVGIDESLKFKTLALVVAQIGLAYLTNFIPLWANLFILYFVGATIAQALFLAIHEITHDLAFKKKVLNNWLALIANVPIVFPFAMLFKKYHALHHWNQGKDNIDTDIPSRLEARLFKSRVGKFIWAFFQIIFYAFRPMLTKRIEIDKWQIINVIFQLACVVGLYFVVGNSGLVYMMLSLFVAGSIVHPLSGHFISEHYVMKKGQETYSYYGPLNALSFNVGYHNEHHDFPTIPGSRLPKLRKLAPKYYDSLKFYKSWVRLLYDFVSKDDITLYSRVKRP